MKSNFLRKIRGATPTFPPSRPATARASSPMYLSPAKQAPVIRDILAARPRRVIFNPGAENPGAASILQQHGISVEEACTLVLLSTGQF